MKAKGGGRGGAGKGSRGVRGEWEGASVLLSLPAVPGTMWSPIGPGPVQSCGCRTHSEPAAGRRGEGWKTDRVSLTHRGRNVVFFLVNNGNFFFFFSVSLQRSCQAAQSDRESERESEKKKETCSAEFNPRQAHNFLPAFLPPPSALLLLSAPLPLLLLLLLFPLLLLSPPFRPHDERAPRTWPQRGAGNAALPSPRGDISARSAELRRRSAHRARGDGSGSALRLAGRRALRRAQSLLQVSSSGRPGLPSGRAGREEEGGRGRSRVPGAGGCAETWGRLSARSRAGGACGGITALPKKCTPVAGVSTQGHKQAHTLA